MYLYYQKHHIYLLLINFFLKYNYKRSKKGIRMNVQQPGDNPLFNRPLPQPPAQPGQLGAHSIQPPAEPPLAIPVRALPSTSTAPATPTDKRKTRGWKKLANPKQTLTEIGEKVLKQVNKKTKELGRKMADRGSGYKATLDKVGSEIKETFLESSTPTKGIEQNHLEEAAVHQAEIGFNETTWRESTKYQKVSESILECLQTRLQQPKMEEAKSVYSTIIEKEDLTAAAKAYSRGDSAHAKCMSHLTKAVGYLEGKIESKNPRQKHVLYKKELRNALRSGEYEFYKGQDNPPGHIKLLNAMAAAEFTGVDVGKFTQELAEGRINTTIQEKTGKELTPLERSKGLPELFDAAIDMDRMRLVHSGVGNLEQLGPQVRGEWRPLGLDPLMQGNPANIKCRVTNANGKEIVCVRTPTPTDGNSKITPEFKAFLRDLGSQGLKYTYVNLQSRLAPPAWKQVKAVGLDGEFKRVKSIEALSRDPEFRDVLTVVSLDKNSAFHHQLPSRDALQKGIDLLNEVLEDATQGKSSIGESDRQALVAKVAKFDRAITNKHEWTTLTEEIVAEVSKLGLVEQLPPELRLEQTAFVNEFMEQLKSPNSGFYLPEEWRNDDNTMQEIREKLNGVATIVFGGKTHLTPAERQDFVEIGYMFLTDWAVQKSGADFFHQGCKDNIDRGGGANGLMVSFLTYAKAMRSESSSPEEQAKIKEMILALPAKLEEDAIWARKRGMLDERHERALTALHRLVDLAKTKPGALDDLISLYNFKDISFQTLP